MGASCGDGLGYQACPPKPLGTKSAPSPIPVDHAEPSRCFVIAAVLGHSPANDLPSECQLCLFLKVTCLVDVSVRVFGGDMYFGGIPW